MKQTYLQNITELGNSTKLSRYEDASCKFYQNCGTSFPTLKVNYLRMKNYILIIPALALFLSGCMDKKELYVQSPNGNISFQMDVSDSKVAYRVWYSNATFIQESELGLVLSGNDTITNNLSVLSVSYNTIDTTWEQPWGEKRFILNNYNEIYIRCKEKTGKERMVNFIIRAFDDGIGFRYEIPEQPGVDSIVITDELTSFTFPDDHTCWWIRAYRDNRYEYLYTQSQLSEVDTVHTPFTLEAKNGLDISIHEAALINYPSMTLAHVGRNKLKCDLVPWSDGIKVKTKGQLITPWRTIQIAEKPGDLITSYMNLNLNEPGKLPDLSWIKPVKYMGIWWAMHIGKYTFWESEKQGATTEHAKMYIDFASKYGIKYLLIEGWNKGWAPDWYVDKLHFFNFTKCADNFDFDEVIKYAKSKGVNIIGYHETGANVDNYLAQIDSGMKKYTDAGIHNIKIGQVGSRLQLKEWHHGQYGVEYYQYVLDKAAGYKLAVNFHEPIKPTGLRRTYPNLMSAEGARGQEYNAWSEGNPPEHETILPFTRLLAGPMDFTPGIFNIKTTRVHTTLAKQLALYVIIYSPVQMLADLPENYDNHPAFKFLLDVPIDWDDTKVIDAKIGDYVTIARKDRNSENWYMGSITDEKSRSFEVGLSFLDAESKYKAVIYADTDDACFDSNPEVYKIDSLEVNSNTILPVKLAPGGGCAVQFIKQ